MTVAGTKSEVAELKKGFMVPSPCVKTADMTRIIRSEEVQNVVRAPKTDFTPKAQRCKPNPLRNVAALELLNPYAAKMRKEVNEQAARAVKKQRAKKKLTKEVKTAKRLFREVLQKESDFQGEDYDQFSKWLGITQ